MNNVSGTNQIKKKVRIAATAEIEMTCVEQVFRFRKLVITSKVMRQGNEFTLVKQIRLVMQLEEDKVDDYFPPFGKTDKFELAEKYLANAVANHLMWGNLRRHMQLFQLRIVQIMT